MADWLLDAIADARIAMRSYRRQPRFTIVALLTLALGIGGTTAMFSVVNAVLLRPPPLPAPERLVLVRESHASDVRTNPAASYPDYQDLRSRHDLFASVEGYDGTNVTVSDAGVVEMVRGARITWGFFDMLGVRPARGRSFTIEDDVPGGTNAVIVTDGFWRRHFGAADDVVGRTMTINGVPYVVRGVLPRGFYFAPGGDADLWLPIDRSAETRTQRFNRWLNVVARLRDGVTVDVARSRTADVMRALEAQYPETNTGRGAIVTLLHEDAMAEIGRPVVVLFGAVALVLLIACANVASLLVVHVVLALAGGALGAWLASALIPILLAKMPDAMFDRAPALRVVSVDLAAFAFAAGTAVLTAVAFGLAPALVASGKSVNETLRSGGRTGTGRAHHRLRDSIVTAEIGMTFVILVAAVLMGRSVVALLRLNAGFTAEHVATVRVALSGPAYQSGQRQQQFFENALERVRTLPGVEGAGAISQPPLGGSGANSFRVDGEPVPPPSERPEAMTRAVAGDYFRTLRIPILHGRPLTARDDTTSAYAIVINESLARRLFSSPGSALGRRLRVHGWQDSAWTIVGVAGDVKTGRLDQPASPTIYYSHLQGPANRMTVLAG